MSVAVLLPFPFFTDIDGQPLEGGFVYIGQPGLNPVNNPINIYTDSSLTTLLPQPLRTTSGVVLINGKPQRIFVANTDYSISVFNKNNSLLYTYLSSNLIFDGLITTEKIADGAVTDTKLADNVVSEFKIRDFAVTSNKLATGAVTPRSISSGGPSWGFGGQFLGIPSGPTADRPFDAGDGYIRYNNELKQYEGFSDGGWGALGGGATGGGSDSVFYLNGQIVNDDYEIPAGQNAHSVGPVTINNGVTVTVPSGSRWVIS